VKKREQKEVFQSSKEVWLLLQEIVGIWQWVGG
jgi:hypothetical protein